jgi:multidrug resistance efflux pump
MLILLLLIYLLPIYLIFFRFKLLAMTPFWRVFLWIPPLLGAIFLWFALGRYTPTVATAYVQAPVVQVAAEVSGMVTRVPVADNLSISANQTLLELEQQPYQHQLAQATAKAVEAKQSYLVQYAGVYAARENLAKAETGVNVTQKKLESARLNLQTAEQSATEIAKQLEVAESILARTAELLEAKAVSRDEWERASSSAAAVRAQSLEARNRIASSLAEVEIAELQSQNADAAVREARAVLAKNELMVEPVGALRKSLTRRQPGLVRRWSA